MEKHYSNMQAELLDVLIGLVSRALIKSVNTEGERRIEFGTDATLDDMDETDEEIILMFTYPIPINVHVGRYYVKYAPANRDKFFKARLPKSLIDGVGDRPSKKNFKRARDAENYRMMFIERFELSRQFAEVENGS